MPKKGSVVKFKNYRNSEMVPFVIYADIESLLEPIQSCGPNPGGSYTKKFQKHKPISFSYYFKCFDDNVFSRENLKQYLSLGLMLTRIRRGIKFEESEWLKPYIDMNTKLRTKAKNNFEKDFFKLMNNAVFGKTMENIRNRVDVKLVNDIVKARKLVAKPNFNHLNIFCEELIAIHMKKTGLTMNKPVYVGMCILDLSKTIMYEFHYNYIKPKYGDKARLLFTDTDSLMYEIQTKDFYKDISGDVKDRFDTSDYPPNHPSGIPTGCNKKVLGMFKDEAGGKIINEFVGLRAKLYSFKMYEGKETKKCKGVKKIGG